MIRLLAPILAVGLLSTTTAVEITLKGHRFTLPDGFEIQCVAEPPLVDRPIMVDSDEEGGLYVADSSGSNASVEDQLRDKPHRVLRLEDQDGDGIYDRRTVFADKLMFPAGVLWHRGSLYVTAPPSIWKLTDTDADGIADKREEWFQGKTLTGCANDLHGPYLGKDGWIYWTKGAFAEQSYARPDGQAPFVTSAAHIFRRHPDKPWIEPVMTGGMDNPVEVVFNAEGERFFTTTFLQHPGGGRRDGIIHAIYGGVYGKNHHVIESHPQTGDLMPVMTHLGPAAACALALYESTVFGDAFKGNLFSSEFNLRSVTRHILEPQGASYTTTSTPFLVSDQLDFHPTDVCEDADGSLLVTDTGGWYKLCCPTSQLMKPDVLGAIYRIRRSDQPTLEDPRGLELSWALNENLAPRLGDARPAVRKRAIDQLALRKAVAPLTNLLEQESAAITAKQSALWTLTRIQNDEARAAIRKVLSNRNLSWGLRHIAAHAAGLWRDQAALGALTTLLTTEDSPPTVKRAAAEALGRLGHADAIPALLSEAGQEPDRVLEHSLIYALIEIAQAAPLQKALRQGNPDRKRAALIALDQMRPSPSTPDMVLAVANSGIPRLEETAAWLLGKHPEWAPQIADHLETRLDETSAQQLIQKLAPQPTIQQMIAEQLGGEHAQHLLLALTKSSISEPSPELLAALANHLNTQNGPLTLTVLAGLGAKPTALRHSAMTQALDEIANRPSIPMEGRLQALALAAHKKLTDPMAKIAIEGLGHQQALRTRSFAGRVLSEAALTPSQHADLASALSGLAPMEVATMLPLFSEESDLTLGLALVSSLKANTTIGSVPAATIRAAFKQAPAEVHAQLRPLFDQITEGLSKQGEQVDKLLARLPPGDIRRGQTVFNSTEAACITCHEIGYRGGNLGPDLTSIGQARSPRDLLESIMFPSASFVRSYESVTLKSKDGTTYLGIIGDSSADTLTLRLAPTAEIVLNRNDIVDRHPATTSLMPQGIHTQLTEQQLSDLLAFLKGTRWR